ncbi:MAG: CotH kinase family protein [Paludibacteraceae bacterium]|nr:CotH kinase family protein [Paludibacteraceae bacterium]
MKKFLLMALLCMGCAGMWAMTIPQGTLYFDNSKTGYSTVKFVYGRDDVALTKVLDMTHDGQKWSVTIAQTETDIYRFTFVGGSIESGTYTQRFSDFKEYVSHTLSINRTATSEAQMQAGDIFVPVNGDNWAQGSWMSLASWEGTQTGNPESVTISGTLPVVYLNTTNGVAITSKEVYVPGSLYIDPLNTGYAALGCDTLPVTGQFKGRGNWTWTGFDKKPYRIKFDSKQQVLGMPKNKHWCLMAAADDCMGYLKNYMGYKLSEAIGLKWTPQCVPVELVLNGKYQGLYFLTEQIRVGSNRVDVTEQDDNAVDSVSGGWLVEIDNYYEEGNVTVYEGNGQQVWITMKSPEILSNAQRTYIEGQLNGLNNAIWGTNEADLWSRLDLDEAVKYYLVQELLEDCESYHGSCYLYKERDRNGVNEKWYFGPVWDFGNAYNRGWDTWIYDSPTWPQYWIGKLAIWPAFQAKLQEVWWTFYHTQPDAIRTQISTFTALINQAAQRDAQVWDGTQNYCNNSNLTAKRNDFLSRFNARVNWLYTQWGEGIKPATNGLESCQPSAVSVQKIIKDGHIYLMYEGQVYDVRGVRLVNGTW